MNFSEVKMYQAVKIGGKMDSHISATASHADPFYAHREVVLKDFNGMGVLIKTSKDEILVPYTNIAYAKIDNTVAEAAKEVIKTHAKVLKKLAD